MRNTEIKFPFYIDDALIFNEVRLRDMELLNKYQELVKSKKYDKASELLQNSEVDYHGAYIPNLFNRRLRIIEEYLKNTDLNDKVVYSGNSYDDYRENQVWIGNSYEVKDFNNVKFTYRGGEETQGHSTTITHEDGTIEEIDYPPIELYRIYSLSNASDFSNYILNQPFKTKLRFANGDFEYKIMAQTPSLINDIMIIFEDGKTIPYKKEINFVGCTVYKDYEQKGE